MAEKIELRCVNKECERHGKVQGQTQGVKPWSCSACWTDYNADLKPEAPKDPISQLSEQVEAVSTIASAKAALRAIVAHLREAKHDGR